MDATPEDGTLTTHPLTFNGEHLFANTSCAEGSLRVEVLGEDGLTIEPYAIENSIPLRTDKTRAVVQWMGAADLSPLATKAVRFRLHLENGSLFSFWVSPDESGASYGYVAAGDPGFASNRDTVGWAVR